MSRKAPSMAEAFQAATKRQRLLASPSVAHPAPQTDDGTPVRQPSVGGIAASASFSMLGVTPAREKKLPKHKETTFNDPIHGNITMDGLCLSIIDTKEFQRLRKLMQLGTCNYVYYGATHTRFEHSIGVSHFAGKVARNLQTAQPHLNITEEDILCVKVAGLCHDLGHGPFSHVFDGVFIPRIDPNTSWRHEDGSVEMLRLLLHKNKIDKDNALFNLYNLTPKDVLFIEEIIRGTKENERRGRGPEKFYLYDIVNNSRSGLDVDKLDYFMRDMRCTNASSSTCNFQRFIELGRVYAAEPIVGASSSAAARSSAAPVDQAEQKHYMICYPEKMVKEALDVFSVRFRLHQNIYTHKSVKKVEFLITDALEHANEVIRIPGAHTKLHPDGLYKMSECVQDPEALSNLNDHVVTLIELSNDPRLKTSQDLLKRIQDRKFYKCLGKTSYARNSKLNRASDEEIEDMIIQCSVELAQEYQQAHSGTGSDSQLLLTSPQKISRITAVNRVGGSMVATSAAYANGAANGNGNTDGNGESNGEVDMFATITLASPDGCRFIQSQDSLAGDYFMDTDNELSREAFSALGGTNGNGTSALSRPPAVLEKGDLIIDKMHIHYGKKHLNPVENMRFYPKGADPETYVAKRVDEKVYETILPRTFEELAVRVFCRDTKKETAAFKAFERFCNSLNTHKPFPSQSQAEDISFDLEAEMDHGA